MQSLDHPNNPVSNSYKEANKEIAKAESAQPIETEDQSSMTSDDDQLGVANYHTILTQDAWDNLFKRLQTEKRFAIDTETTSLDYRVAEMVGFLSLLMLMMPITYHSHMTTKVHQSSLIVSKYWHK